MRTTIIGGIFAVVAAALYGIVAALVGAHRGASTPTPVVSAPPVVVVDVDSEYVPSGWMGDGKDGQKYLSLERNSSDVFGVQKTVIKITARPGPQGWAAIYWQYPDGNWGTSPGRNLTGHRKLTFLVRGENGGEIVEFKAGGITGKFADTFVQTVGKIDLQKTWDRQTISLGGKDLSNVVGAFCWSAAAADNKSAPIVFYLTDIVIE
jgi:hypothetical protein